MESLVSFGCKNCGSPHLRDRADGKLECLSCRRVFEKNVETSAERDARILYLSRLDDAEKHLRISPPEFDKAESLFRDFIDFYPKNSDGYWGLVRARYGIKYERDIRGVDIPSCYISSYEDFRKDTDFQKALEFAENAQTYKNLTEQADLIAGVCQEWYSEAKNYKYDIFISFKATDDKTGGETLDIEDMKELHSFLLEEGYNVFFSPRSMRRYTGQHYDAYIFNALQTAKAMIVYGSKPEYFTSTWVQNEWTRFLRMEAKGEKKRGSCIVAHKGFSPYELPSELRKIQAIDASKENRFYADVLNAVKRILSEEKKVDSNEELMRKIAELERQREEEKKEEQRRQAEIKRQLEESKKQQDDLRKSLDEERQKNSEKIIKRESKVSAESNNKITLVDSTETKKSDSRNAKIAKATAPQTSSKMSSPVTNTEFVIIDGCLKKYNGKKSEVVIPKEVTSIGFCAFYNCNSLTSITIPNSIKSIGSCAFSSCNSLISVTIPDSVTSIGNSAFSDCNSLTSITIPDSVTSIGENTFWGCKSLTIYLNHIEQTKKWNPKWNPDNRPVKVKGKTVSKDATVEENTKKVESKTASNLKSPSLNMSDSEFLIIDGCLKKYNGKKSAVVIPKEVTSIGFFAFYNCSSLTSVTIPNSVKSIGSCAFASCNNLTSVTIPDSVTSIGNSAFSDCNSLTSITIPDSVTSIGENMFLGCKSLTIYVNNLEQTKTWDSNWNPDNRPVKVIEKATNVVADELTVVVDESTVVYDKPTVVADESTSSKVEAIPIVEVLEEVEKEISEPDPDFEIEDGCLKKYKGNKSEVVIPDGVTSIKGEFLKGVFQECKTVTKVIIPDSVTTIGYDAFYDCSSLVSVTIPNSVTSIGHRAFYGCSSLTSITIPDSVTSIGTSAFDNCSSLTSITIPNSVTEIGGVLFRGCASLASITVDVNNQYYKSIDGNLYTKDGTTLIQYAIGKRAATFEIPSNVTNIGVCAFYGCDSLTSITIPNSVTTIGNLAFYNCASLTKVTIPDDVTFIGSTAFYGCSRLSNILIGNSVSSISYDTFSGCSSLTSITIPGNVTSIHKRAFDGCKSLASAIFEDSKGWVATNKMPVPLLFLNNAKTAAKYLTSTFVESDWTKK